jgi:hypothetical protein
MATPIYYAGPGKVYLQSPGNGTPTYIGLQPTDVNGQITCSVEEKTDTHGAAMYGELFETLADVTGKISTTPFDNWGLLPYLFPSYLGVTTAGTNGAAGALSIGTSPHDPTATSAALLSQSPNIYPAGVYTSDGREYNFNRAAITKHPNMKFGPGEKLFGPVELTALGQLVISAAVGLPGTTGFLMSALAGTPTGTPITESGASDPDTTGWTTSDFGQTHFVGAWGAVSGFTNLEAEDSWELVPDITYNTYSTQKVSRIMKLAKARFGIKARLVGMSHTQLLGKVLAHTSGGILKESSPTNLVLTGSNGKTITLVNCEPRTAPFEFGSTKLNLGEVMFVQTITVSSVPAVAAPSLIFSA